MTCASCANVIENNLNRLEGVTSTVNYATETAGVDYDPLSVAADQRWVDHRRGVPGSDR